MIHSNKTHLIINVIGLPYIKRVRRRQHRSKSGNNFLIAQAIPLSSSAHFSCRASSRQIAHRNGKSLRLARNRRIFLQPKKRGKYKPGLRLKYKTDMNSTTACTPNSGFTPQSFAMSLIIFQIISLNLPVDLYTYNSSLYEKGVLFRCSFSAFNRSFPQCSGSICVKCSFSFFPDLCLRQ